MLDPPSAHKFTLHECDHGWYVTCLCLFRTLHYRTADWAIREWNGHFHVVLSDNVKGASSAGR